MSNKLWTYIVIGFTAFIAIFGFALSTNVKNYSKYDFSVENFESIEVGKTTTLGLTLSSSQVNSYGYDKVTISVDVSDKDNLDVSLQEKQTEQISSNVCGYINSFSLSNSYYKTTDLSLLAKKEGAYNIKINLIDLKNNNILTTKTIYFIALN